MEIKLPLELLRSEWLIMEGALDAYRPLVEAYFANALEAQKISTGLFAKIDIPNVPDNMASVIMNGVLTKADICGGLGTRSMANQITAAANDSQYDSIALFAENVPGGQVDGTKTMADAVWNARQKKPVVGILSGVVGSAGVWIMEMCTEVIATSETDMFGCIGVLAQMKNPKTAAQGENIIVYSDLSPNKNVEFRDAQAMKDHMLNPTAELFHNDVKKGRSDKLKLNQEDVLSGAIYMASAAKKHGMIDGIMPMNKAIARAALLGRIQKNKK